MEASPGSTAHTTPQISPPVSEPSSREMTPHEARQELREAVRGSNEVLASATTKLSFFSDTVTLDRAKLTVTKRNFFNTAEVMSMRIEDVLNITATVGPYFGTVKIVSRVLNAEKPYVVGRLTRKDALEFKRIAQGYVIALQRNIDCNSLPTDELKSILQGLGEDEHPAEP